MAVADSQGGLGYIVGNSLRVRARPPRAPDRVACLLTQTVVDADDPAFTRPSKPIGAVLHRRGGARPPGAGRLDHGRGRRPRIPARRAVAPTAAHRGSAGDPRAARRGFVVIAAGGGGIPVVETAPGVYRGVEAVVDKDLASALLAPRWASRAPPLHRRGEGGDPLSAAGPAATWTGSRGRGAAASGGRRVPRGQHGARRSRRPSRFSSAEGGEVVITSPDHLEAAVAGQTGTTHGD